MSLIKAKLWIERDFSEDSRPHLKTVRRWFDKGLLNGQLVENHLYIDSAKPFKSDKVKKEEGKFKPTLQLG